MIRRALAVAACVLLVAAPPILAAVLRLDGGSLAVFTVVPQLPIARASVDIQPESLERRSQGQNVTAFVEAPSSAFDVRRIVPESIRLCLGGPLCDAGAAADATRVVGDSSASRRLKVTFPRAAVLALVADIPAPATVTFVVSALLADGTACAGSDAVRLVDPDSAAATQPLPGDEPGPSPSLSGSPEDASPSPSVVPAPSPHASAPPSSEPSPPGEPPTPDPGGEPTIEPSPTPAVTAEPTPVATARPTPPPAPTPEPTPEPAPTPDPGAAPTPGVAPAPSPPPGDGDP